MELKRNCVEILTGTMYMVARHPSQLYVLEMCSCIVTALLYCDSSNTCCISSIILGWKAPPKGIGEWGQRDIMPSPGQGSMNSQWQIQRSTFALSQNGHPVA